MANSPNGQQLRQPTASTANSPDDQQTQQPKALMANRSNGQQPQWPTDLVATTLKAQQARVCQHGLGTLLVGTRGSGFQVMPCPQEAESVLKELKPHFPSF